jgi:hypothetical protein
MRAVAFYLGLALASRCRFDNLHVSLIHRSSNFVSNISSRQGHLSKTEVKGWYISPGMLCYRAWTLVRVESEYIGCFSYAGRASFG